MATTTASSTTTAVATSTIQTPDQIIPNETSEPLSLPTVDVEDKPSEPENRQNHPNKDERTVPSQDASRNPQINVNVQLGSTGAAGDGGAVYSPSVYAPQAQSFYYGGYENSAGEWGDYRHYVGLESLDVGSTGVFNDNPSLMFHTGYGYNPQMPYGPYSPVTTPLPSVRGDGQLYSQQQFPFSGQPYYQQPIPPSMPYITATTPVSQGDLAIPLSIDQQSDGMYYGQRAGGQPQFGSYGRGGSGFAGNSGNSGFYDSRQAYDGFGSGGLWSDWSKSPDAQRSYNPLLSPAASPQPISTFGSLGRNAGMASQQQRATYGYGSGSTSYTRSHQNNGIYSRSDFRSPSISSLGTSESWLAIEKAKRRGRDSVSACGCDGTTPDILSEQNRGPRASKPKSQITTEHASSVDAGSKNVLSAAGARKELYNQPDFAINYEDAKFFIIKSYSEDNVHKSIKYGIWASTPNGNRKLDGAYHEAKEKQKGSCPVFLFFSVNASAQFCGVAEMVGPVDFDKSVSYWQQDKWSGQFPVKWHIIKDVPNSQFRHIILENNDSKPVTNSRDTQEVKLDQGLEMLGILKNYETDLSILDDFDFYEERQKAMQERKARQQQQQQQQQGGSSLNNQTHPVVGGNEHQSAVITSECLKQLPKSFAQVVRLEESTNNHKEENHLTTEKGGGSIATSDSIGNRLKPEDTTEQLKVGG